MNNAGVGYYLVAHAHVWHLGIPISPISLLHHTVQIIAGNGGTKLDPLVGAKWPGSIFRIHPGGSAEGRRSNNEELRPLLRSDELSDTIPTISVSNDDPPYPRI